MQKLAAEAVKVYPFAGRLRAGDNGYVLLDVPNSLLYGAFAALDHAAAELPKRNDTVRAHITVFRPDEVEQLGGVDKIVEISRRDLFYYTLGPVKTVNPADWDGVKRVWFIECESPGLEMLRQRYGLTAKPNNDQYEYHITFAVEHA